VIQPNKLPETVATDEGVSRVGLRTDSISRCLDAFLEQRTNRRVRQQCIFLISRTSIHSCFARC
jgi:hypothetical protein